MKLRTRLLFSIGLTMAVLFFGISQVSQRLMLRSFEKLESDAAVNNLERVHQTIELMIAELHIKSSDWAMWDDTYRFMQDRNPAFLESNLNESALRFLLLDTVMLIGNDRKVAASCTIRRDAKLEPPAVPDLLESIKPNLMRGDKHRDGWSGYLIHRGAPLLVSIRPVYNSEGEGRQRGWVVFGTYLNSHRLGTIRRITRLEVDMFPAGVNLPAEAARLDASHRQVMPISDSEIQGFVRIKDLYGHPSLVLRTKETRTIFIQGEAQVRLMNEVILIIGLIFSVVVLFVLERFALGRLSRLTNQVENIATGRATDQVRVSGQDELSLLATRINEMLGTLAAERQHVEEQRNEIRAKNVVLESAIEGIVQLDARGKYRSVNAAYVQMIGCSAEKLMGESCLLDISSDDHGALLTALRKTHEEGRADLLLRGLRRDGSVLYLEATLIPSLDADGDASGHHLFVKDVTQRKLLEMEIEHQAFHDKLTGLANRALFMDRIDEALERVKLLRLGVAALFIDLDNFKRVNDSLGHDAGDLLLIEVANRLRASVRPGDTVARLGGDEFTILLEKLGSASEAEEVARRVLESLCAPIELNGIEVEASATIGIAFTNDPETTRENLLKNADQTMYLAKSRGKGCYALFSDEIEGSTAA